MNGKILKKLNESTPDYLKRLLSRPIRLKVINNKIFKNTIKEIESWESKSFEEKGKIHFEKVREILIYSYENTKYYKKIFDNISFNPYDFKDINEINKIPVINKQIIIDNFDDIVSKEVRNHYIAYTGGSTGKPLKILLDTESIYKEKAFVYSYWSKFGYDYKKTKSIALRGLDFNDKLYKYNPIDNQIVLNPFKLNEDTIYEYITIINKFRPEFIHGYASAIYNMSKIVNKKNVTFNTKIKGICFISENVEEYERLYIEKTFNCKSNIFYGHSERAVFAEFINNSYEFNDIYTHVSLIPTEDENSYRISCTGLINKKMPLINYVTDDKVIIRNEKKLIYGHWDKELLIGKNGEKISIAAINFHNKVFEKINRYQFEQFLAGKVIFNIVEDEELSCEDIKQIKKTINLKLKNVLDVEVKLVKNISLTKRGKFNKIIQHING